jgi:phosphoribosylaminoimidazole-succinocarboxamide synthase/phosphoribosylformylglycinamidine synthase
MARVVVDVMPKPEILDPQGKAVTGALARLGFAGMSVRQGKRFELEFDGEVTEERLAEVRRAAETLLANTVIETFDVRVEPTPESAGAVDEAQNSQAGNNQAENNKAENNKAENSKADGSEVDGSEAQSAEEAELAARAG